MYETFIKLGSPMLVRNNILQSMGQTIRYTPGMHGFPAQGLTVAPFALCFIQ